MKFTYFALTGVDAAKFLQGQITSDVARIGEQFTPTAICNLKGRVHFGLWLRVIDDGFGIVLSADMGEEFAKHIKKYGAFSKITLSEPQPIFPAIIDDQPSFGSENDGEQWAALSIATGNYWITKATSELFQPQELRLHQRGGVAYDKGCYLGQEIVARLYFKASPKAYLHRIAFTNANMLSEKIAIVNQIATESGFEALVIARPEDLANVSELGLPPALQANVARA